MTGSRWAERPKYLSARFDSKGGLASVHFEQVRHVIASEVMVMLLLALLSF